MVQVMADTAEEAQSAAEETAAWATERAAAFETPYELRAGPTVTASSGGMSLWGWLLLTIGVCCGIASAVLFRRAEHVERLARREPLPADTGTEGDSGRS